MSEYSTLYSVTEAGTVVDPFLGTDLPEKVKPQLHGWRLIEVDEKGRIKLLYFSDWYHSWCCSDEFAEFLSHRMKAGRITLTFKNDDGERWGYVVEPEAIVEFQGSRFNPESYRGLGGKDLFHRLLIEASHHYQQKSDALRKKAQAIFENKQEVA